MAVLVEILSKLLGRVSAIYHGLELICAVSMGAVAWGAYDSACIRLSHNSRHLVVLISRLCDIQSQLKVSAISPTGVHYYTWIPSALFLGSDRGFHHSIASNGKGTLRD